MILQRTAFLVAIAACTALPFAARAAATADDMGRRNSKIHGPIPLQGATMKQARLAILQGMLFNKGVRLTYEGETANTISARWDYRGGTVLFDIRYDEEKIQIFYKDASEAYACQRLQDGICLDGTYVYYNYMPNFHKSIRIQLKKVRMQK